MLRSFREALGVKNDPFGHRLLNGFSMSFQEQPKNGQERPKSAQEAAKNEPRAAKNDPRAAKSRPRVDFTLAFPLFLHSGYFYVRLMCVLHDCTLAFLHSCIIALLRSCCILAFLHSSCMQRGHEVVVFSLMAQLGPHS